MIEKITEPPESLVFTSLADLYQQFLVLFIGQEFRCPRGMRIAITSHHFFHLVKLSKCMQTEFTIEVEEPMILATKDGFGAYAINEKRARTMSWIPEILCEPHEIWEYKTKK